ncbi:MAG: Hpt domain-containing protein [Pseudomonadota bacterium]
MIDWNRVAELREEVGPDDFMEVAELFISEVEDTLDGLKGGVNVDTIEESLHFLKGAALNLGFAHFAGLCRDGEFRAAAADYGSIDLGAVHTSFAQSRQHFLEGLAQQKAG